MSLQNQINEDIKTAMRQSNTATLTVLRQLKTAISTVALQNGNIQTPLDDVQVNTIIRKQIAQRDDAAKQFTAGKRPELAEKERVEIAILKTYLPPELSDETINNFIQQAIIEVSATSKKDMGKVIKRVIEFTNGAVDGRVISQKIATILN